MLSRKRRISRKLFEDLVKNPSVKPLFVNSAHFSLRSVPSPTGEAHVAVSVSKKVAKKAVDRNRTRRRAYASVSKFVDYLKPNLFLVSAKGGADKLKGDALVRELEELFSSFRK